MILQVTPTIDTSNMTTLLASLIIILMGALAYLFKVNADQSKEHKEDLKLFDNENKKSSQELLQILNKFHLAIEEGKLSEDDSKKKLERIILLLEKRFDNG